MTNEFEEMERTLRNKASTGDQAAMAQLAIFLAVREFDKSSKRASRAMIALGSAAVLFAILQVAAAVLNLVRYR